MSTLPNIVGGKPSLLFAALVLSAFVLVAPAAATPALPQLAPIFGMETEPVDGQVTVKWRALAFDIDAEQQVLAHCRSGAACPAAAQSLMDIVAEGAGHVGLARVGLINRAVDLAIAPANDQTQWGVADHWSPPFETLQFRRGVPATEPGPTSVGVFARPGQRTAAEGVTCPVCWRRCVGPSSETGLLKKSSCVDHRQVVM